MICSWTSMEGLLAGQWRLETLLGVRDDIAYYNGVHGETNANKLVEVIAADGDRAPEVKKSWEMAAKLHHPNVLKVHATGEIESGEDQAFYAVLDLPDDDVSERLGRGPIGDEEIRAVATAAAKGLTFLHSRGMTHGAVSPASLLIFGSSLQLNADTLAPATDERQREDIRQLGRTIMTAGVSSSDLRDVIDGCLGTTVPQWTAAEVVERLNAPRLLPSPAPVSKPSLPGWRLGLVVALLASAIVTYLLFKPADPKPVAQTPAASSRLTVAPPIQDAAPALTERRREVSQLPPPAPPVERPARDSSWALIAATYGSHAAARNRAEKLQGLRAKVYPEEGQGKKYYVILASGLSKKEAEQTRRTLMAQGAPRDTYVTKLAVR